MTADPLFPVFFVLMGATVTWLALVWRLFAMMKARAPEAYASIGFPHIIHNNTILNNVAFLRFVLGGHYGNVGDDGVRRLCALLRAFFWLYLVGLVGFCMAVFGAPAFASKP